MDRRSGSRGEALYFRDAFRDARAEVLRDGENFDQVLFALERFGSFLRPTAHSLNGYRDSIRTEAARSPLAEDVPTVHSIWHVPFDRLYELVREGRNRAAHEGAYARQLADHAVEVALILEDALMADRSTVGEYMVRDPIVANVWEPLSFLRQKMLRRSYSFLPVRLEENDRLSWRFLADRALASYLRGSGEGLKEGDRKRRLMQPLSEARDTGLELDEAAWYSPDARIDVVVGSIDYRPILVCDGDEGERLIGILTAFDLL